jgi:hypothetical protein
MPSRDAILDATAIPTRFDHLDTALHALLAYLDAEPPTERSGEPHHDAVADAAREISRQLYTARTQLASKRHQLMTDSESRTHPTAS